MKVENYKKAIITFLESRDNYADIDLTQIEELCYQLSLLEQIKVQLDETGMVVDTSWGRKQSVEFQTYQQLITMVRNGFTNLGISPSMRLKLKLEAAEKNDAFDEVFSR